MLRLYFGRKSFAQSRSCELYIDAVTLPSSAVLLDVDGTILDLAPTPLEVVVPPDLTVALERSEQAHRRRARLRQRAAARRARFVLPAAQAPGDRRPRGRAAPRRRDRCVARPRFSIRELKKDIASIADDKPGVVVEDKSYSVAVHYRQAPHLGHDGARRGERDLRAVSLDRDRDPAGQVGGRGEAALVQQGHRGARADAARAVPRGAGRSSSATT